MKREDIYRKLFLDEEDITIEIFEDNKWKEYKDEYLINPFNDKIVFLKNYDLVIDVDKYGNEEINTLDDGYKIVYEFYIDDYGKTWRFKYE